MVSDQWLLVLKEIKTESENQQARVLKFTIEYIHEYVQTNMSLTNRTLRGIEIYMEGKVMSMSPRQYHDYFL